MRSEPAAAVRSTAPSSGLDAQDGQDAYATRRTSPHTLAAAAAKQRATERRLGGDEPELEVSFIVGDDRDPFHVRLRLVTVEDAGPEPGTWSGCPRCDRPGAHGTTLTMVNLVVPASVWTSTSSPERRLSNALASGD